MKRLKDIDREIYEAIKAEEKRQEGNLELIASENFVDLPILEAMGSVLTNKYAEGYPGKRYYGGCEFVDVAERLAIQRAKELFGAEHANVQPHSGTQANMAAYLALMEPGDPFLGLNLSHGGHLSHGHPLNFSGKIYQIHYYGVDKETETVDFDALRALAREVRPKMIMVGASAYPRILDYAKFREICDEVGAYMVADIAHIAGLIVAGLHPSPVPYADVVTTTTHKTLRGPRGGLILCRKEHRKAINRALFPGIQGGPLMHIIAAKAVCFKLAMTEEFKAYQRQIVANAKAMAEEFLRLGYRLVAGGTDTHLFLIDVKHSKGMTGRDAEEALDRAGITVNKNTIPYDEEKPLITSGIRIGTPALTTRGMKEQEMVKVAQLIDKVLSNIENEKVIEEVKGEVRELTSAFPLYRNTKQPIDL